MNLIAEKGTNPCVGRLNNHPTLTPGFVNRRESNENTTVLSLDLLIETEFVFSESFVAAWQQEVKNSEHDAPTGFWNISHFSLRTSTNLTCRLRLPNGESLRESFIFRRTKPGVEVLSLLL